MVKQCRVEPCMLKNYSGNFLIMLLINMNQTNRKWSMLQNFHEIGVWTNGLCKPHSNLCVLHKVRKISPRKVIVTRMPSFRVGKLPLNLAAVTGGGNFLLVIGMGWCVVYIYQSFFCIVHQKGYTCIQNKYLHWLFDNVLSCNFIYHCDEIKHNPFIRKIIWLVY